MSSGWKQDQVPTSLLSHGQTLLDQQEIFDGASPKSSGILIASSFSSGFHQTHGTVVDMRCSADRCGRRSDLFGRA